MEFDKSRVYTAFNADELKIGSKIIAADNLKDLKDKVLCSTGLVTKKLDIIALESESSRFVTEEGYVWALAYLIEEPEEQGLKWTDLSIGYVVRNKSCNLFYAVTGIDTNVSSGTHIHLAAYNRGNGWLTDEELRDWELVTEGV